MAPLRSIWCCTLEEDVDGIKELICDGVPVDSRNSVGETCLHLAARHGLEVVVKVLLNAGASVHILDWESGWTPLHRSLYFGHIRVSLLLLKAGACLDGGRNEATVQGFTGGESKPCSRGRSESLGPYAARRRSDHLGDHDGNTPLDLLSLELRPCLSQARAREEGGDVFSFGKADFFLGYDSLGAVDVVRPRRIEALANLKVIRVAASRYHSVAVTLSGKVFTWGHGRGGRLGHGNEDVCMLPTLVEGLADQKVVEVAASDTHTAAITRDGALYTWGRNRFGQLGHGSGASGRLAPKRVEALRKVVVVAIASGMEHTVAVATVGTCYTWGRNNHGQLGFDGPSQASVPRAVSHLSSGAFRGTAVVGRHVIKVSASARSTVVVTYGVDRGSGLSPVNEVYQWGQGTAQPSRVNFNIFSGSGSSSSRWQTYDARVNIIQVAAAKNHNLALSSVGQTFSWGFGADNLGLDPRETRTAQGAKLVAAMLPENCGGNAVYISASDRHSCVVTDTGDLFTWGTAGEGVGALGHGDRNWQPVAKRVTSLKKVALVAAAPDHTLVLLQASCPSLPYAESLDTVSDGSRNQPGGINTSSISEGSEDGEDTDSDFEGRDDDVGESSRDGNNTAIAWFKSDLSEPPTLKQHCEMVLAREVDLRNAPTILAYADALDAPALVEYCAEFVSTNLDGILVLGRPSDQDCLLETSGALACTMLGTVKGKSRQASSILKALGDCTAEHALPHRPEDEGLNREAMATALAPAEMRAEIPSATIAARAVRSLKKKIARISELEMMRDSGKDLTADQMSKVQEKPRMEAELGRLDSRLERAKIAHGARARRLETEGVMPEPSRNPAMPKAKRTTFLDEKPNHTLVRPAVEEDNYGRSTEGSSSLDQQMAPKLDLSQDGPQTNVQQSFKCEACGVECADARMYGDHLRGKRHKARMAKSGQQLHDSEKESHVHAQHPRTWAHISPPTPGGAGSPPTSASTTSVTCDVAHARASRPEIVSVLAGNNHRSNQRADGGSWRTMRSKLQEQEQAATMFVARGSRHDPTTQSSSQQPAFAMSTLRSTHLPTSKYQTSQHAAPSAGAYSLTDFVTASRSTKSRRKGSVDRGSEARTPRAWATEGDESAADIVRDGVEKGAVSTSESVKAEGRMRTRKSFSEIIAEEERARQERDEYGDSVWFVSRKPRSTSFETIIHEQRRAEAAAEEEKIREAENVLEEEMLRLVLEISKNDAQPSQARAPSHGKPTRGGRKRSSFSSGEAGNGAALSVSRHTDCAGTNTAPRVNAPARNRSSARAHIVADSPGESARPGTDCRKRRQKSHHNSPGCSTSLDQAPARGREEMKFGTSAP